MSVLATSMVAPGLTFLIGSVASMGNSWVMGNNPFTIENILLFTGSIMAVLVGAWIFLRFHKIHNTYGSARVMGVLYLLNERSKKMESELGDLSGNKD